MDISPPKDTLLFILAAGKSSRMAMDLPKVLLPVGGRPMLDAVLETGQSLCKGENTYLVVSQDLKNRLKPLRDPSLHWVVQEEPLGTGHAVALALAAAERDHPDLSSRKILILLGDTPLLLGEEIQNFLEKSQGHDVFILGMVPPDPQGYGRLCVEEDHLVRIVESKDARGQEGNITLCHSGVMVLDAAFLQESLARLVPSGVTGELYLTDLVAYAQNPGYLVGSWDHLRGINTREELTEGEAALQRRFRQRALDQGAYLMSPETTFLSYDTQCAPGVWIYPMVCCGVGVRLEEGVVVYSGSVLEGCHVKKSCRVGPFARLRSGTVLEPFSEVGNFVETKNLHLGQGSKIKHLSYIGDAVVGQEVNIGASVVTCNYDGHVKSTTHVGDGVFVGSHTSLVAPISLGKNATIGAGSTLTKSVGPETLALSRSEQKNIPLPAGSKHLRRSKKKISL